MNRRTRGRARHEEGGPEGPPSPKQLRLRVGLPVVAAGRGGLAAALAVRRAVTRVATARSAGDAERVARARVRRHGETGGGGRRNGDLTLAGANVEARGAQLASRVALGVVLGVREAGLNVRDEVAGIRLGRCVLALLLLTEERGQGDRGEDADDQDDNEELDERETLFVLAQVA